MQADCIFCDARDDTSSASLVVTRAETCFVVLNLYPYNSGHLMVVPNRHLAALAEASHEQLAELMMMARRAEIALAEAYRPDGMNIGINLGNAGGAGVPWHLHLHLVPRWTGDTNFMTVVGATRVLPEDPLQTLKRLRPIFERLADDG
ncbi:MAG: HIT family hydrolase [Acidobacteria bacterium]|nr:HIT family hydrolase [Acidobacteriota bacterium]